jgi:hypothetical protein
VGKPSAVDAFGIKSEAGQKKTHLTCDAKPLLTWFVNQQTNGFAQRVAVALKAGTLSANVLAQAIDVANVLPLKDSCSAAVKRFVLNGAKAWQRHRVWDCFFCW